MVRNLVVVNEIAKLCDLVNRTVNAAKVGFGRVYDNELAFFIVEILLIDNIFMVLTETLYFFFGEITIPEGEKIVRFGKFFRTPCV